MATVHYEDTSFDTVFLPWCTSIPPLPFMSRAQIPAAQCCPWTMCNAYLQVENKLAVNHYYLKQCCANPAGETNGMRQQTSNAWWSFAAESIGVCVGKDGERGELGSDSAPKVGGCRLVHQGASGGCCRVPAKWISTLPPNHSRSLLGYR